MPSPSRQISVLYDNQIFETQKYGGISRYFYELAKRMEHVDSKIAIIFSKNYYISEKDITQYYAGVPEQIYKMLRGMFKIANNWNTIIKLAREFDLLHPTYYNPYFLPYLKDKKFVLTVHDMIHEKFPEYFSKDDKTASNKALLVEKATRIIAINQNTKNDLVKILNVDPDKIDVIYHGINTTITGYNKLILPEKYILYVGERSGYKNFDRLLEAFKIIHCENPDLKLVCTGKKFKSGELTSFENAGLKDEIIYVNANDLELEQLYSQAHVFVYPSIYEGFGIPILEAYSFSCPIALSNTSCFPEIAGYAGEFFDPYSVPDIIRAINNVINNPERRSQLIDFGHQRVKRYTWNETARQTELSYFRALGISSF